jgi:hypothetical protein
MHGEQARIHALPGAGLLCTLLGEPALDAAGGLHGGLEPRRGGRGVLGPCAGGRLRSALAELTHEIVGIEAG